MRVGVIDINTNGCGQKPRELCQFLFVMTPELDENPIPVGFIEAPLKERVDCVTCFVLARRNVVVLHDCVYSTPHYRSYPFAVKLNARPTRRQADKFKFHL